MNEDQQKQTTYSIAPAKYSKDKFVIQSVSDGTGYKTECHNLAEAVGGRWRGRDKGYQVSAPQVKLFEFLVENEFTAGTLIYPGQKPRFWDKERKEYTLGEVKKLARETSNK